MRNKTVGIIRATNSSSLAAIKIFFITAIHQKKATVGELWLQHE
jgi:hypothetical protein